MAQKSWYKYTDESGRCWRIQTSAVLADIGGLQLTDAASLKPLPASIKPRYVWLQEFPRPKDRLSARQKVIIERGRLGEIWRPDVDFELSGKRLHCRSYYGEIMYAK